jgi:hypothetical protein
VSPSDRQLADYADEVATFHGNADHGPPFDVALTFEPDPAAPTEAEGWDAGSLVYVVCDSAGMEVLRSPYEEICNEFVANRRHVPLLLGLLGVAR